MARVRRCARFIRIVVTHPRLPKWARWGLLVLLAIPGPVDELAALLVLAVVAVVYRDEVRRCWEASRES